MKTCPVCSGQVEDGSRFCTNCGYDFETQRAAQQSAGQGAPVYGAPVYTAPQQDPTDHTSEFDAKDISENKVISMLAYLLGPVGVVIALLAANTSPYAGFHVRQSLKITVVDILLGFVAILLVWTVIVPIVAGLALLALGIVKIVCFFQICKGQAKEPPIICKLGFLK